MENKKRNIILFDGVCTLCNGAVQFIIKRNTTLQFTSLQSASGQSLLKSFHLPTEQFHSIVYITENDYHTKSTAVLHIAKQLTGAWKLLYVVIIIPRPIRDFVYDLVAQSRFKLFGMRETCFIPTPELKERFLE